MGEAWDAYRQLLALAPYQGLKATSGIFRTYNVFGVGCSGAGLGCRASGLELGGWDLHSIVVLCQ